MTFNRYNKLVAIATTLAVHIIVLFILGSIVLRSEPPREELGGIYVQVGYIDEAQETFDPFSSTPIEPIEPIEEPQIESAEPSIEEVIVQDSEETVALEEQKKREAEEKRRKEEEQRKREEEQRLLAEQREKEQRVSNAMQGAFGPQSAGSSGVAEQGEGVQGSATGNTSTGVSQGVGGWGGFSLQGRRCLELPKPTYNSNVEGTVVVEITVDKEGRVLAATVKAGSAPNAALRTAALEAAKKARFDTSDKPNNQVGTITYYFKQR